MFDLLPIQIKFFFLGFHSMPSVDIIFFCSFKFQHNFMQINTIQQKMYKLIYSMDRLALILHLNKKFDCDGAYNKAFSESGMNELLFIAFQIKKSTRNIAFLAFITKSKHSSSHPIKLIGMMCIIIMVK